MNIALILTTNYPDAQWSLDGDDYSGLVWLSDTPKPTKASLEKQSAQVEYQAEVDAITQQRLHAYQNESDPIYMEAQRDPSRTIAEWEAKIEEIKTRYPYPPKPEA